MSSPLGLNLTASRPLPSPAELIAALPASPAQSALVHASRATIRQIMLGLDPRLVAVVGPCSIHDVDAGRDYARRLAALARELDDRLVIVLRAYFEKPRTALGWPGLLHDPTLDGTGDLALGLRLARGFLGDVLALGLPTATEFLDPLVPHYLADFVCWAAIGARTSESQIHRQLASGLAMPVGFKNSTDGRLQPAIHAIATAQRPHTLLGLLPDGRPAALRTAGNPHAHLVLRGGAIGPNYSALHVASAAASLDREHLPRAIMIDCSHGNSGRRADHQPEVLADVIRQRVDGDRAIFGFMLESNLAAGHQPLRLPLTDLAPGVSVTDPCLDWATTEHCLREAHAALAPKKSSRSATARPFPVAAAG